MPKWFVRFRVQRYRSPYLHEGEGWVGPSLVGAGDQLRVVWYRPQLPKPPLEHEHVVQVCTIGSGTAHEDVCPCGKKRYGVFGVWE